MQIRSLQDVPDYQLCCGCGLCAYLHPDMIHMADAPSFGRRPIFTRDRELFDSFKNTLKLCPGVGLSFSSEALLQNGLIDSLTDEWGPVLEVWEGYAADSEIRFKGSSGGAISAISLYCLERGGMHGVLHTKADEGKPYLNKTTLSRNRESILSGAGSRYSPASPCEKLHEIETSPAQCVFIGKPCDVAAVQHTRQYKSSLNEKIGLTMACFCAGTPSTNGTLEMLRKMDIDPSDKLASLRYRGFGWPGKTTAVKYTDNGIIHHELTYEESWGHILQKYRQWRCYICPDHTGEFADIAIGDPWYKEIKEGESGHSLILVRTETGKRIMTEAIRLGYLIAEKVDPLLLPASQKGFPKSRAMLWGRLMALKLTFAPCPSYNGFLLKSLWKKNLTYKDKAKAILGTIKRIYLKKLKKRQTITFDS